LQKKEKGYAYHTVRDMLSCLSSAMDYAKISCHYIKTNPCDDVKMPKFPPDKGRENFNGYVCRGEDFKKLITRFPEGSPFYVPIMTGYCLGTRIGESYGIDLKTDINFEDNTITIERQMQYRQPYWYVQPPKYNSVRTIKMGGTFAEIIRKVILERKKNMLKYGEYYIRTYVSPEGKIIELPSSVEAPQDYIERWFINTRECGSLLTTNSFKYCARVAHRELDLPLFHSHCLRHTHGTILAENKVSPKVIMKRLGHKDIATTLQIYVFDTEEMHEDAMEIFDREAI
ncbi:MAG: tyrosine-type recombinase/integrase, partial [Candidatus Avilachnospira sp.]|jgi:integrase